MPVINNETDNRLADLLEELIDQISEHISNPDTVEAVKELIPGLEGQPPTINVNVPRQEPPTVEVNVPPGQQPIVQVAPPQITLTPRLSIKPEIHVSPKSPEVNVSAPNVTVNPPKITVEAPKVTVNSSSAKTPWVFKITRDEAGRIETMTATPK